MAAEFRPAPGPHGGLEAAMHPTPRFEELDYRQTPLGELILRRRSILSLDNLEVHEIILGDAYLMSSLFTEVEQALSRLGLAAAGRDFPGKARLDVVVGGLGLGYTARAALEQDAVGSLIVVDYLQPVIEWHERGLVPLGPGLVADPRCRFVHGDFFALAGAEEEAPAFDPDAPGRRFHAVLLDIDHSPSNLLHERHATFYSPSGLRRLAAKLHPGGIFALWSDDPPEAAFMSALEEVFESCESHIVTFVNPLRDEESASTVYVARTRGEERA
jgi:spermidine synthase